MARENLLIVRGLYERGSMLEGPAAPDVEADLSAVYPDRPVLRGVEAIREFRDAAWGSMTFKPTRFFEIDDERVLVLVEATAEGRGSGAQVTASPAHEFTIRDGLIVRFKVYPDQAQALEAVGLSS